MTTFGVDMRFEMRSMVPLSSPLGRLEEQEARRQLILNLCPSTRQLLEDALQLDRLLTDTPTVSLKLVSWGKITTIAVNQTNPCVNDRCRRRHAQHSLDGQTNSRPELLHRRSSRLGR